MKEKKGLIYYIVALIFVLVFFNIIAFIIPFNRTTTFYVSYGFTLGAILISFAISFYAFRGNLKSKFYGFPLIYLAWGYLIFQTILGLIFMAFSGVSYKVPLILCLVLLGAYLIGMMATDATQDYVEDIDQKVKKSTFFTKSLQSDIAEISSGMSDDRVRQALSELGEDVRYSDPVSLEQLSDIESRISGKVLDLRDCVAAGKNEEALALIGEIKNLIALRNQKSKLLK